MTRREPPAPDVDGRHLLYVAHAWFRQGISDLAEGRHAKGCECKVTGTAEGFVTKIKNVKIDYACLTIAKALGDFESYEVEEP